jgi:hypothetical protein
MNKLHDVLLIDLAPFQHRHLKAQQKKVRSSRSKKIPQTTHRVITIGDVTSRLKCHGQYESKKQHQKRDVRRNLTHKMKLSESSSSVQHVMSLSFQAAIRTRLDHKLPH